MIESVLDINVPEVKKEYSSILIVFGLGVFLGIISKWLLGTVISFLLLGGFIYYLVKSSNKEQLLC